MDQYESLLEKLEPLLGGENDKKYLEDSRSVLSHYKMTIQEQSRDKTTALRLLEYQEAVIGFEERFDITPQRKLLNANTCILQINSPLEEERSPKGKHYVIICNDILICSRLTKKSEIKGKKFIHLCSINLNQCALKDIPGDKNAISLCEHEDSDIGKEFIFFCRSKEEIQEWKTAITSAMEYCSTNKIIGVLLSDLMSSEQEKGNLVPSIIDKCTIHLVSSGALKKEGLIRVSANASDIMDLTKKINAGKLESFDDVDPHLAVCLLKKFFRDMPDSVFTKAKYQEFIDAGEYNNSGVIFYFYIDFLK